MHSNYTIAIVLLILTTLVAIGTIIMGNKQKRSNEVKRGRK